MTHMTSHNLPGHKNNAHKEEFPFEALSFMQFKFMTKNKRSPIVLKRKLRGWRASLGVTVYSW